ncbi:hypothetical protein D3C85_1660870 [compost metagenome]
MVVLPLVPLDGAAFAGVLALLFDAAGTPLIISALLKGLSSGFQIKPVNSASLASLSIGSTAPSTSRTVTMCVSSLSRNLNLSRLLTV